MAQNLALEITLKLEFRLGSSNGIRVLFSEVTTLEDKKIRSRCFVLTPPLYVEKYSFDFT